jgi:hypothetical protein
MYYSTIKELMEDSDIDIVGTTIYQYELKNSGKLEPTVNFRAPNKISKKK